MTHWCIALSLPLRDNVVTSSLPTTRCRARAPRTHLNVLKRRIQFESVEWLEKQLKNGMLKQLASLALQGTHGKVRLAARAATALVCHLCCDCVH